MKQTMTFFITQAQYPPENVNTTYSEGRLPEEQKETENKKAEAETRKQEGHSPRNSPSRHYKNDDGQRTSSEDPGTTLPTLNRHTNAEHQRNCQSNQNQLALPGNQQALSDGLNMRKITRNINTDY